MIEIRKWSTIEKESLGFLFDVFKSSCPVGIDITFEEFLRCSREIYMCIDTDRFGRAKEYYGIAGARLVSKDNINAFDLPYHSLPNNYCYSIDFAHYIGYDDDKEVDVLISLIKQLCLDLNDGFIYYIPKCPTSIEEEFLPKLIDLGFEKDDSYLDGDRYIKKPTVYGEIDQE